MHSKNQKHHGSPGPSRSSLVPMKTKTSAVAPAVNPSPGDTLPFRVPKDYPHSRFNKAPLAVYPPKGSRSKPCVSLPVVSLEKMPCLSRTNSASNMRINSSSPSSHKSSSLTSALSQRSSEKLLNGRGNAGPQTPRSSPSMSSVDGRPSPARSPLDRRPSSTPSPSSHPDRKPSPSLSQRISALPSSSSTLDKKQQNGTKTSPARSHRRLSGRVFDPNKHCGVPDPETKRPCTRSLTCKSHSLTQRRAVLGRRKDFNVLLAEHKDRAKEKEKEGPKEREKEREAAQERKELNQSAPCHEASPSKPHCPNGRPLSTLKLRLANAHIPRVPGPISSSTTLPPRPNPPPVPVPEPAPSSWTSSTGDATRLSSDEGDTETPEETDRESVHFSSRHPQPLGLCVFNSRLMGRGHYVFDRRWDRMRVALQNMVEKHLNSQMWRKVPLAAESLQSPSGSSSASSQQPHPPSPLSGSSPISTANCYTATFPQTTGVFSIRDAPLSQTQTTLSRAANGTNKSCRPAKVTEESSVMSKKRKSSSFYSLSSLFPAIDNHKKNGNGHHPMLGGGESAASPVRRKELGGGGGGPWGSPNTWTSRTGGDHNSHHSSDSVVSSPYTSTDQTSVPLSHGGRAESRKRRSPSSYRGKASKLSRSGDLGSLFGKGEDSSGILASGSESPRQVKMHR